MSEIFLMVHELKSNKKIQKLHLRTAEILRDALSMTEFELRLTLLTNEPRREKTDLRVFGHRRWLEAGNFGFRKKRDSTICVVKT